MDGLLIGGSGVYGASSCSQPCLPLGPLYWRCDVHWLMLVGCSRHCLERPVISVKRPGDNMDQCFDLYGCQSPLPSSPPPCRTCCHVALWLDGCLKM